MSNRLLAIYGTEFDDLDDDQVTVSKKPVPIQDQVVTDERGRRRFHGAFSGGFSAGYFNTVGSKEGWTPQEFRSTREQRSSQNQQSAEDIMDEEDLGEFGIGARRIRQSSTFSGETAGGKRRLAWEHDETSSSAISNRIETIVRPLRNSVGVRILREMGWREGRGVGLATTKQMKTRGGTSTEADFDRQQAAKVAPGYQLALEDELVAQLKSVEGVHGLGYQGLRQTSVLDESYGKSASALKHNKKGRGIRGQAFGVGAFEDDDESVYSQFDLNQYDFALEGPGGAAKAIEAPSIDSSFEEMSKCLKPRKFYAAPRLPPNFKPDHKPIVMDAQRLPDGVQKALTNLSIVQRAQLLGEDRVSVMEMLSDKDRKTLKEAKIGRSRWDQRPSGDQEERESNSVNRIEFPDEPMKQARFKEFLTYIRRGLAYPQPTDMSVWEWEAEKKDFEAKLTSDERGMLPEVRSRSQPLAKSSLALPIQELLQSKFTRETGSGGQTGRKDEDKLSAVKMGMFGERTRTMFQWYPASALAKRFNVPNPYPGASMVGVPHLQKVTNNETLLNLGLPNTANELMMRQKEKLSSRLSDTQGESVGTGVGEKKKEENDESTRERLPDSIFDAIFGDDSEASGSSSSSSDDGESEGEEKKPASRTRKSSSESGDETGDRDGREDRPSEGGPSTSTTKNKVITVMDIVDDEYGPAPPPSSGHEAIAGFSVLRYLQEELARKKEKKAKRKKKEVKHHKKDSSKKSKKDKKRKKSKKEKKSTSRDADSEDDKEDGKRRKKSKKRQRSRSSSQSSGDSDVVEID